MVQGPGTVPAFNPNGYNIYATGYTPIPGAKLNYYFSGHETARHGPAPHPHGEHYREWLGGNRPVYVNVFIGHKDIYYVV